MPISWIACGEEFSSAITRDGKLFMWGLGAYGQLGLGNTGSMKVPRQVMCEPLEQVACGGGHVIARTTSEGVLTWGYPGTWPQLKAHERATEAAAAAAGSSDDGDEHEATGSVSFASRLKQTHAAVGTAPLLLPLALPLGMDAYSGPTSASGGAAPLSCRHVAAGRHCALFVGEPVQPMPENEAALMIQCTFRRDRAQKKVDTKRKEDEAAAVIGGRASDYLARKALMTAQQVKEDVERAAAATKMQAHQRRRLQAKQAEDKRLAALPQAPKDVVWATGINAAPGKKSRSEELVAKPAPPSKPKRTGGGFSRRR